MNSGMRLIVYTGKGGTGKTVSCSTAIKLADRNYRTLVISSDPAHTLGDAFIQQISGDTSDVIEVFPNLYALQVDPIIEINRQYGEILTYTASIFSSKGNRQ
jgi:arsenite/tail-anchored protein-transporting ATPase